MRCLAENLVVITWIIGKSAYFYHVLYGEAQQEISLKEQPQAIARRRILDSRLHAMGFGHSASGCCLGPVWDAIGCPVYRALCWWCGVYV